MKAVVEAIDRSDYEVALVEALALWRARKHAVLADLIDAIAAKCKPAKLVGRDKKAYHAAWLELAKRTDDPSVIAALGAGLSKSVPQREIQWLNRGRDLKRNRPLLERLDALAKCEDDPRTASALAELLDKTPFSVEDVGGVYGPAIDLIVRIGDERSIVRLRDLVARPLAKTATIRDYFAAALPKAADAIEKSLRKRKPLADRESAEALLAKLGAKKPTAQHKNIDVAALVADCLANPADDGLREVLADVLLEREDPKGEFIQLQLRDARRELAEPDRKKMQSLQRKHEKTWLGDLTRVTKLRLFRRGFLDECEMLQGAAADKATWARVANDPVLASIRTLHKGNASEDLYRTFTFSPHMTSLQDLEVPSTAMLRDLNRPIEHIILTNGLTKEALVLLDGVAKRCGIKRLSFEVKSTPKALIEQMVEWESRHRFVELCVMPHRRASEQWWTDPKAWLLAFDELAPVKRLGMGRRDDRIVVERGARGLRVEVHASQEWAVCQAVKLPKIEKLVVRGTPAAWFPPTQSFTKAIKKLPASAVELHDGWLAHRP